MFIAAWEAELADGRGGGGLDGRDGNGNVQIIRWDYTVAN